MRKLWKHVLTWLIIAALLASLTGCDGALWTRRAAYVQTPLPLATAAPAPASVPDSGAAEQFSYSAPDLDALTQALKELEAEVEAGGEPAALLERYAAVVGMYDAADAAAQIAYLLYAEDVTEKTYWDEYARINEVLLELDVTMTDVSVAMLDSSDEANRLARERFGDGYVDAVYAGEALNDEAVVDLFVADNALQAEYDTLLTTFSFKDGGRSWTLDDILGDDTLGYERYVALYNRYCEALNREAGALFIEMLALRADIAAKLGFGSYAAYRYACYGRDYTVTEAGDFHEAVKKYIVPVFISANTRTDIYDLYYATYGQEEFLDDFAAVLDGNSPASEALAFMRERRLYDFSVSDKKMEGSFTIYISSLEQPYIFTQWEGDSYSVGTVMHEFGHFLNYYCNPESGWCSGDSLDLAEIDSQAFVLLMSPYYDRLYGAEYAQMAETDQLLDALYALVTGSMEDEFQQRVYADPGMTLEEMNELYAQLARAYGMDEIYGFTGTEWALISHTFQSPMYYISYAVSMMAALELWRAQQSGEGDAWDIYMNILMRKPYAGFRDTLEENGLGDPLSASSVKRIAESIDSGIPHGRAAEES